MNYKSKIASFSEQPPSRIQSTHVDQKIVDVLRSLLNLYQLLRLPQPMSYLLQAILNTAIESIPGAQRGSLLVREGDWLVYRAASGYNLEQLQRIRFLVAQVETNLIAGQRVLQVRDFADWNQRHLDEQTNLLLQEHGMIDQIRCSLIAPIYIEDTFYGTLVLNNLHSDEPFLPIAEAMVMVFAEQTGTLIEHAQVIEQLRSTSNMLAEADRLAALGHLVAGVTHEINNPLTAVLGHADLLVDEPLTDEGRESLLQIQTSARRMRQIIHNLLMFARQQHGGHERMQINDVLTRTLSLKRMALTIDQIDIQLLLAPNLPLTWGNPGQIGQVFLNLLINAHDALRDHQGQRQVTIHSWLEPGDPLGFAPQIRISFADNGPGIPADVQSRIFDPFFTTKPTGKGTGLGLSACYGIMIEHGGQIWVEQTPGGGATFQLALPVLEVPRSASSGIPPVKVPSGYRILLIEDDAAMIELVYRMLGKQNVLMLTGNLGHALQMLHDTPIDLVLCAMRLSELDGQNLFQHIQQVAPALTQRLLFLSMVQPEPAIRTFLRQSQLPLLSSPFTSNELYSAIANLLTS